jgi:hypothetical protein
VKRREFLSTAAAIPAVSALVGCERIAERGASMPSQPRSVGIWLAAPGVSTLIAGADFVESATTQSVYSLPKPITAKLPSGLLVEVSCERIATGHFHVGISHNDKLYSMGKYAGPFDVRVFPDGHASYVVSVKWDV